MFVDYVEIFVTAGKGGDGAVAFRREKYIPKGGPSGGDGGKGGAVIIQVSRSLHTLVDFRYHHHFRAENGANGQRNNKTGKQGMDCVILVPIGTVVKTKEGKFLADLKEDGQNIVVATGGKGGRGNAHFATATHQTPRFAEKGEPGTKAQLVLELKLLADVGLIGYPNSGKSTLLSAISNSRPKIAPYPFTTLQPYLGLVRLPSQREFVAADIPGLIEGAHQGKGLGIRFLRHIERTRVLIHLVDISEPQPLEHYRKIRQELNCYGAHLAEKPELVVANKIDQPHTKEALASFRRALKDEGKEVLAISALQRTGLEEVLAAVANLLEN